MDATDSNPHGWYSRYSDLAVYTSGEGAIFYYANGTDTGGTNSNNSERYRRYPLRTDTFDIDMSDYTQCTFEYTITSITSNSRYTGTLELARNNSSSNQDTTVAYVSLSSTGTFTSTSSITSYSGSSFLTLRCGSAHTDDQDLIVYQPRATITKIYLS